MSAKADGWAFAQINNTDISYILEADQVTQVGENMYEAVGNVVLKAKGLTITAEKVMYNSATTEVQADGNVKISLKLLLKIKLQRL